VDVRVTDSADALAGVDMFAGLEPEARQRVMAAAVPRTYRKGQLLFVEGDPGDRLENRLRSAIAERHNSSGLADTWPPGAGREYRVKLRPGHFFAPQCRVGRNDASAEG